MSAVQVIGAPTGGIFIPRSDGVEGWIGSSHIFIDRSAGGVIDVVSGDWPRFERLARMELTFAVRKRRVAATVPVLQSLDRSPEIIFIEEGNDRIGVRIKFRLTDRDRIYHGYGMTEAWLYPDGSMFLDAAACFEDSIAHEAVTDARVAFTLSNRYTDALTKKGAGQVKLGALASPMKILFGDSFIPGRAVTVSGSGIPPLSLFWRTGKLDLMCWPARGGYDPKNTGAPSYFRWVTFLPQAFGKAMSADGALKSVHLGKGRADLVWNDTGRSPDAVPSYSAVFRLAVPADEAAVKRLVNAEREPLTFTVKGGTVWDNAKNTCGYIDNEGVYQVHKTGNPMTVILPADPAGRTVRVKAIRIDSSGAVTAKLDGKPLVPHLASEGGIADDPLAPIREQPEGSADMALVTVKLTDRPQELVFSEEDGVQLAYQTRDPWRNFMCFSTKTGKRWSAFRFSPVDGRMRNIRKPGKPEWALTENLMTWFKDCGQSPVDMIDSIRDFRILKNGPDEVVFYYRSANANDRAQSEYTVRVPADSPATRFGVKTAFTVLEYWPYTTNQFFDIFPFRGVDPREWWYDTVLWLTPEGRMKWESTRKWTFEGDTNLTEITGDGFFALMSSDRGNMLVLNKNFNPRMPVNYIICGNYIDYHMDVNFIDANGKPKFPEKGFRMSMEYELALWGDGSATRDQVVDIGKKSLTAGTLVLPEK